MEYGADCGHMDSPLSCNRWPYRPKKLGGLLKVTSKLTLLERQPAQGSTPHTSPNLPPAFPVATLLTAHLSLYLGARGKHVYFSTAPDRP